MPSNRMVSMIPLRCWPGDPNDDSCPGRVERQRNETRDPAQKSLGPGSSLANARSAGTRGPPSLLRGLHRILDRLEGGELDVVELAVLLLDLADVDVLDDVAGVRIDRDRTARALPLRPLHGRDQLVAIGIAIGLLQRFV